MLLCNIYPSLSTVTLFIRVKDMPIYIPLASTDRANRNLDYLFSHNVKTDRTKPTSFSRLSLSFGL